MKPDGGIGQGGEGNGSSGHAADPTSVHLSPFFPLCNSVVDYLSVQAAPCPVMSFPALSKDWSFGQAHPLMGSWAQAWLTELSCSYVSHQAGR